MEMKHTDVSHVIISDLIQKTNLGKVEWEVDELGENALSATFKIEGGNSTFDICIEESVIEISDIADNKILIRTGDVPNELRMRLYQAIYNWYNLEKTNVDKEVIEKRQRLLNALKYL